MQYQFYVVEYWRSKVNFRKSLTHFIFPSLYFNIDKVLTSAPLRELPNQEFPIYWFSNTDYIIVDFNSFLYCNLFETVIYLVNLSLIVLFLLHLRYCIYKVLHRVSNRRLLLSGSYRNHIPVGTKAKYIFLNFVGNCPDILSKLSKINTKISK